MILGLTGFQKFGAIVVVLALVIWVIFLAFQMFRSGRAPGYEIEEAPNRKPYYDDDTLETSRLDRFLGMALFFLLICSVGLALYFTNESNRQTQASAALVKDAEHRGEELFASYCAGCHGADAAGGVAKSSIPSNPEDKASAPKPVQWTAPPLNTVLLRYTQIQVQTVIEYGRPNTPMPAWSVKGGASMNEQQVTDLIQYLESIQLSTARARAQTRVASVAGYNYPYDQAPGNNGALLFARYCARCHTHGWSYQDPAAGLYPEVPGGGAFGPSLRDGATIRQFPNMQDQIDFITIGAFANNKATLADGPLPPFKTYPYGTRGVGSVSGGGMPAFGQMLSQEQIKAIVEYERSLGLPNEQPLPQPIGAQ